MYCPQCGKADQETESYCRNCGEFLLDHSGRSFLVSRLLGSSKPTTQITVNVVIDLITIFTCFLLLGILNGHYDALRVRTGEQPPSVIYVVYAFLIAIAAWQFFSLVIGLRLRTKLGRKNVPDIEPKTSASPKTQEFLPDADQFGTAPLSVTEDSTRILENAKRN